MSLQNVALFDLEGTLTDYEGGMRLDLAALAAPDEVPYSVYGKVPKHIMRRMDFIQQRPGWWQQLGDYDLGFDILQSCLAIGFRIHVLVQGVEDRSEASLEKVRWFQEHILPRVPDAAITIVRDKSTISGDVLVDDYPGSLHRWLEPRPFGLGVMPVKDSNHDFTHAQVLRYDGMNLNTVAERLREAYRR